jgi:succinate-acetate transporter protein
MVTTETRNANTPALAISAPAASNPGPLGLAGFAAPWLILSFVNAGVLDVSALVGAVLPIGLFSGGLGMIIAGVLESRRGNTFGTTAFVTYGAFWLAFAGYIQFFSTNASAAATGMFVLVFAIISAYLTLAAVRVSVVVFLMFVSLTLSYTVLTIASFASSADIQHIGGWLGVFASVFAFYGSAATVVNDTWKRVVLPTFPR